MFTFRNSKHVPVINLVTCAVLQQDTRSLHQSWNWTLRIIQGQIRPVNSYFSFRANVFRCSLFHSLNFLLHSTFSVNTSFGCFLSFSSLRANQQRQDFILCLWLLVAPLMLLWRLELCAKAISSGTTAKFGEENWSGAFERGDYKFAGLLSRRCHAGILADVFLRRHFFHIFIISSIQLKLNPNNPNFLMPRPECALSSVLSGEGSSWSLNEITSHFLSLQEMKGYNGGHLKEDSRVDRRQRDTCLFETCPGFFVVVSFKKSHPIYFKAKVGVSTGSLNLQENDFFCIFLLSSPKRPFEVAASTNLPRHFTICPT